MSFTLFSFNPENIKKESIKYFQKRSTEMYILRYRCPNDDVFDPLNHLNSLKSVFLTPKGDLSVPKLTKKNITENVFVEDLLSLAITDPQQDDQTKVPTNQKYTNSNKKQIKNSNSEQSYKPNSTIHRKVHTLFDELTQSDIYSISNSNDILKVIFRQIKEKNYIEAFESISKSINIYSQYEITNHQPFNKSKKDLSSVILFTAIVGLLLSYSVHDEEKQYEYFDIIADYPIDHSDLPHFYHLIDEILVTNNGIRQLTLAHLLGFPSQFFIPTDLSDHIKSSFRSKRSKSKSRSGFKKNDPVFNFIMSKKFKHMRGHHDYDNDSFNGDYSDNEYDYYDFESDSDIDFDDDNFDNYDDFDYDFIKSRHFHSHHGNDLDSLDERSLSDMPPDIKKEFLHRSLMHEKKRLFDMKIKKRMLKEESISSKKSFESNKFNKNAKNKKEFNNNKNNGNKSHHWKVITKLNKDSKDTKTNNQSSNRFEKCSVDEIQVTPLLNVVFRVDPKSSYIPKMNQYYAYKASNSSRIVNCNFIPNNKYSNYNCFNDNDYNYCCLSHFTQPGISNSYTIGSGKQIDSSSTEYIGKKDYQFYSKYIKMIEAKETIKSISDSSIKNPLPILACEFQPDDDDDETLAAEIESAIAKPNLFSSKSKLFLKSQEKFDDFMDSFDSSCNLLRSFKSNGNQKNIRISTKSDPGTNISSSFLPAFPSDDDDDDFADDDGNFAIINNMFNKDIILKSQPHEAFSILSQINPLISSLKSEKMQNPDQGTVSYKKSYVVQSPGTKTTTEIKKIGIGTTITKITTTSNMTFQDGNFFTDDDTNIHPSKPSKDKKRKSRRDGK